MADLLSGTGRAATSCGPPLLPPLFLPAQRDPIVDEGVGFPAGQAEGDRPVVAVDELIVDPQSPAAGRTPTPLLRKGQVVPRPHRVVVIALDSGDRSLGLALLLSRPVAHRGFPLSLRAWATALTGGVERLLGALADLRFPCRSRSEAPAALPGSVPWRSPAVVAHHALGVCLVFHLAQSVEGHPPGRWQVRGRGLPRVRGLPCDHLLAGTRRVKL